MPIHIIMHLLLYAMLSITALTRAYTPITDPTIYMIRHGEKPGNGINGLNFQGLQRAQCLRSVFGRNSEYNIGYIMANMPGINGNRNRPLETVKPLAADLGLTVDTSCDRNDYDCVKKAVKAYTGPGNILICWEHIALTPILETLGVEHAPEYPHGRFDLIWTVPPPYLSVTNERSENCPALDL
ncbi:uncharacterized protein N7515_002181 [Penicillium bovifimosum]|uniref:Phosphoglycerate mutase family protein n=1 Tax=Penicillium bovifimosum TaxID=126998 RepID=A0A9W9HB55_9EURO|nr:uncharacterized protein N7515_002181 [Penicillium bovifimosum]KAJ5143394.1 hypothetical protein N7515_002181 [Penicillium bovifimosum]